jgi:signal transduction histidine kinase
MADRAGAIVSCGAGADASVTPGMVATGDESARDSLAAVADPVFLLQTLFAEAPVAFAIAHVDGRCLAVNRVFRELFGSAPPPEYNIFRDELVAAQGLLPLVERAFGGEPVAAPAFWYDASRLEHVRVAGRRVAIEMSMTPLKDRDGAVRHVALCYKDVTAELDRERMRQLEQSNLRLLEAGRVKAEFLAAMSHELRTPLNAIIGFAELVFYGRVAPGSPEHREFLGDILASGRHLLQLVDDVLDLAMIEAGKLELRPEAIAVESTIGEVAGVLRSASLHKQICVEVQADRALDVVELDPVRFRQVLFNYLSNALKFTPDGGRVVVRATAETAESFRLEVEDTGVGIAPDRVDRLFVDFDHLELRAGNLTGTGLGLALTRKIVEAHGGSVGVRSQLGRGSVFHAVLPRRCPAPAQRPISGA